MTEIRKNNQERARGMLFYDGTCGFCVGNVRRLKPLLNRLRVGTCPFENGADEPEMTLEWEDGSVRGGGEVVLFLARRIWWVAPLGWMEWVPGVRRVVCRVYDAVARRRHCLSDGVCRI